MDRNSTPLRTVYTGPADTFTSLSQSVGASVDDIKTLNPHVASLSELEPGIPLDLPRDTSKALVADRASAFLGQSPYNIAKREKSYNICQLSGSATNDRIALYHSTTVGGAAPDEVAWCSSFVNFCVE